MSLEINGIETLLNKECTLKSGGGIPLAITVTKVAIKAYDLAIELFGFDGNDSLWSIMINQAPVPSPSDKGWINLESVIVRPTLDEKSLEIVALSLNGRVVLKIPLSNIT